MQPLFQPQWQRRRRRVKRLRVTMVMTVGTGDWVMDTQPPEIGPVKVVSYSRQPQAQEEEEIRSISY